jgi:2-polyprenyl-3-methyl-5-hydroxy-6-metoxy-1,4-benzoquinol methylase
MSEVNSIKELHDLLNTIESEPNEDTKRTLWASIILSPQLIDSISMKFVNADPFDDAYMELVLETHKTFAGKMYNTHNEGFSINMEYEVMWGFPYGTQSAHLVGSFLIAYGFLIKTMGLCPGAEILEIGCGTGSLSYHLSKMGYRLTCIDVNEDFLHLVERMTAQCAVKPKLLRMDMNQIDCPQQFDAIIFCESFHHSLWHAQLLSKVCKLLTKEGIIVFAAEPIVADSLSFLPYPWGLRLNGESLRAICKWGWLELGFSESYFYELLHKNDLSFQRFRCMESNWADIIIAKPGAPSIAIGSEFLDFSSSGNASKFMAFGWSVPEQWGTWTDGPRAELVFQLTPPPVKAVVFSTTVGAFVSDQHPSLDVDVFVNGHIMARWSFTNSQNVGERQIIIPLNIAKAPTLRVEFRMYDPKSPAELGLSTDGRKLGLSMYTLRMFEVGSATLACGEMRL